MRLGYASATANTVLKFLPSVDSASPRAAGP
jgi:hypothetical protein